MTQNKRVRVRFDWTDLDGKVTDVISNLQKLQVEHPGCDLEIDLSWDESYGIEAICEYTRPETPEETKEREEKLAHFQRLTEARDRKMFEDLKKRFGS